MFLVVFNDHLIKQNVHVVLPLVLVQVVIVWQGALRGFREDHVLGLAISVVIPIHHALDKQLPQLLDDLEPVLINVLKLVLEA